MAGRVFRDGCEDEQLAHRLFVLGSGTSTNVLSVPARLPPPGAFGGTSVTGGGASPSLARFYTVHVLRSDLSPAHLHLLIDIV